MKHVKTKTKTTQPDTVWQDFNSWQMYIRKQLNETIRHLQTAPKYEMARYSTQYMN